MGSKYPIFIDDLHIGWSDNYRKYHLCITKGIYNVPDFPINILDISAQITSTGENSAFDWNNLNCIKTFSHFKADMLEMIE